MFTIYINRSDLCYCKFMKSFIDNILKNKLKKKTYCDTRTMGVNIDKNEYYEIKLSNSAHPEDAYKKS